MSVEPAIKLQLDVIPLVTWIFCRCEKQRTDIINNLIDSFISTSQWKKIGRNFELSAIKGFFFNLI